MPTKLSESFKILTVNNDTMMLWVQQLSQDSKYLIHILEGEKWLSEKLMEVSFHAHKRTCESQTTDMYLRMQKSSSWRYAELFFFLADW